MKYFTFLIAISLFIACSTKKPVVQDAEQKAQMAKDHMAKEEMMVKEEMAKKDMMAKEHMDKEKMMSEEVIAEEKMKAKEKMMKENSSPGLDLSNMDLSVKPGDDFFRYVNGTWLDNTELPPDRPRWGSFDELRKKSSENVLAVLEEASQSGAYGPKTDQGKVAIIYAQAMDTTGRNKTGVAPLMPYLDKLNAIQTIADIQHYNVETAFIGDRGLFGFAVFPDLMNSAVNGLYLAPGNLGLPERDYYLDDEEKSVELRDSYKAHIERMLGFINYKGDKSEFAQSVLDFETKLATAMMTKEESRNPKVYFARKTMAEVGDMVPSINWKSYLEGMGMQGVEGLIMGDGKYYAAIEDILKSTPIEHIKNYMMWGELDGAASLLTMEMDRANFDFYGKKLNGALEQRPLWERSVGVASGVMGEAIGQLYVDKHFPPEAKTKAQAMIANIKNSFDGRIKGLSWMTDETKEKALEKLKNITVKIGYPDEWKDYGDMDIKSEDNGGTYIGNMIAASKWFFADNISKVGKEVDKTEWGMSPQTVNAYYNPLNNEIVFPAAILQPPFYNYEADEAVNYGGIGAVIGHEISHGFDDQGSRFDATGNMTNWWTEQDRTSFESRNQQLINQFNAYEGLPGENLNGEFTLGENIGDLGGIHVAYDGLQKYLAENGDPGLIDGYTPEQRFFISWGTIWRTKMTAEMTRTLIKTDPHALGQFRAIGPLSNMEAFYKAFDVSEGDRMYRSAKDRVRIW